MERLMKEFLNSGKRLDILSRTNNQGHPKRKTKNGKNFRGNVSDAKGTYRQTQNIIQKCKNKQEPK